MRSISEPVEAMGRDEQVEFARRIALNQLETRARSANELRRAMAKKHVPQDIIDELMQRFAAVGLVDDHAFATALVNTRVKVARRGTRRIRMELREKGVPEDVAANALAAVDPDDELAAASEFAAKKARSMQGLELDVAKRRLYGALARRGFSTDVVRRVTDEALRERGHTSDDQEPWDG